MTCADGESLIRTHLDKEPRWYFEQSSSEYVRTFYSKIDAWDEWLSRVVAGLRRRVQDPEHLVTDAQARFASSRFLRFRLERWNHVGDVVSTIDLSDRATYLAPNGYIALLHALRGTVVEPNWRAVAQTLLDSVRAFAGLVERQLPDIVFFGEPRDLKLDVAMSRLSMLSYVNVAIVKNEVAQAETLVRKGLSRDAAAALRRAIEQLIDNAYAEAAVRQLAPAGLTVREQQTAALGRGFIDRGTARQLYASFSILSDMGSHTGAVLSDDEGDQAWQAGRLAISLAAAKLPH